MACLCWWGVAAAVGHGQGSAGDPPLVVRWSAPPPCPQADDVAAALRARKADDPQAWPALTVDGEVTASGIGYRLTLRIDGERQGERTLAEDRCDAFAEAAAVLVSLTVATDPGSDRAAPTQQGAEAADRAAAEPATRAPTTAEPGTLEPELAGPSNPPALFFGVGGSLDVGTLPRVVAGPALWLGTRMGPWQLTLGGGYFPGTRDPLAQRGNSEVRMSFWDLTLDGCLELPTMGEGVRGGPCAGLALAHLTGQSSGVADEASTGRLRPRARLGGQLYWPVHSHVALRLEAQAQVPLSRATWQVRDFDFRHRPAALGARLGLALVVQP